MLEIIVVGTGSLVLGWLIRGWWLFRKTTLNQLPVATYEVRLTRNSSHGIFSKTIYAGEDLQEAKRVYYSTTGPARTVVELYTRGNHTAGRRV